jgi:ribosomal protein L9
LIAQIKAADGVRYEVIAKADKTGHLYQKIDAEKIALLIGLPESIVAMEHPLKEVGEHTIALKHEKVNASAIVVVVAE